MGGMSLYLLSMNYLIQEDNLFISCSSYNFVSWSYKYGALVLCLNLLPINDWAQMLHASSLMVN